MTAPTGNAALRAAIRRGINAFLTIQSDEALMLPVVQFLANRDDLLVDALAAALPPEQDGYAEAHTTARKIVANGGPHEWGYRDPATGEFIVDNFPYVAALALAAMPATDRHAEGRIAGLEEAAKECDAVSEVGNLTGNRALTEAGEHLAAHLRTIANVGTEV